jgi:hypothetical protein
MNIFFFNNKLLIQANKCIYECESYLFLREKGKFRLEKKRVGNTIF